MKIRCKFFVLLATLLFCSACGTGSASSGETPASSSGSGESEAASSSGAASSQTASSDVALPIAGLNAENYPRVDGSTANMPLIAQVYSSVCGVPLEEAETMVEITTTSPAWRGLVNGTSDLLLVYEPAQAVKTEVESSAVKLESTPIGRDGLVFLANQLNKVENLTQEQLRGIYSGKITDWGEVGGEAGPIAAFQRDAESGSQTLFLKLLMQDTQPMEAPTELVPGFMSDLVDGIASYDGSGGAIGYSVFYYAKEMYAKPNIKLLSVDGVAPSAETIGDGSYPLLNDFYVVIRADEPDGSPARLLRDWLLTDAGRQTLVDAGYVPVQNGQT